MVLLRIKSLSIARNEIVKHIVEVYEAAVPCPEDTCQVNYVSYLKDVIP